MTQIERLNSRTATSSMVSAAFRIDVNTLQDTIMKGADAYLDSTDKLDPDAYHFFRTASELLEKLTRFAASEARITTGDVREGK